MITYMEGKKKVEIEEEVFIIIKEKMEEEENRVRIVAKEKECPPKQNHTPLFHPHPYSPARADAHTSRFCSTSLRHGEWLNDHIIDS